MSEIAVVGIGASAGGLETIREMLSGADEKAPVAYVVVQHLDPNHESMMAELMTPHTSLNVTQASDGEAVTPGHVHVIPPGHGLSITDGTLTLTTFKEPRGLRRPIDDFFISLAEDQGEHAICVILSGTGADGTSGLRAIKEQGGLCVVQDPETARYDGMPLSAVSTGLVDFVKTPKEIVPAILGFLDQKAKDTEAEEAADKIAAHIDDICSSLSAIVGHDFSGYKRSTVTRRITRRMQVLGITEGTDYLRHIRQDPDECQVLMRELLINVTRFFRDDEQFEHLRKTVIVPLIANSDRGEIRVWVPGCSSGEEAYSIAMYFASEMRKARKSILVQIFATDIDDQMLSIARAGVYPTAALVDIPEELREPFTVGRDGSFQIAPVIRDMIRFSSHNLVNDPPFSRLDLISCRNLLIYFGDRLQAQALPVFHYALKPGGFLFLGPSESIGRHEDLFSVQDQKSRLYRRREGRPAYPLELTASSGRPLSDAAAQGSRSRVRHADWDEGYASDRILERYAPPTLRITSEGEILKSSGQFARFLSVSPTRSGPAFVQSLARQGLREILPTLIKTTCEERRRKLVRNIEVVSEVGTQTIDVIADPLPDETILLVLKDKGDFKAFPEDDIDDIQEFDSHEQIIEEELRLTRLRLRSAVEELETANEELKSSNEEMMSMNEELQSTNEELSTVNDELKSKVDELTVANADLSNVFDSINLGLVVVDRSLEVRRFSENASRVFSLNPGDTGRRLPDLRINLADADKVIDWTRDCVNDGTVVEETVDSADGDVDWALNVTPYRTLDGDIDGATLIFTDISAAHRLEAALKQETERLKLALEVARIGIWQYEYETGITKLDENARALFGLDIDEAKDVETILARIAEDDRAAVQEALSEAIAGRADYNALFRINLPDGGVRHLKGLGRKVVGDKTTRLVGVNFDQTADVEADIVRETMIREMNHRIKNLFSIMSALLRLGSRTTETSRELADTLSHRINALAHSHDFSIKQGTEPLPLRDLLWISVSPYAARDRVMLEGEPVTIAENHLTAIALVFHEWATNSVKYGAFSAEDGRLKITWYRSAQDRVHLTWHETASHLLDVDVQPNGFGSRLVELSMSQMNGAMDVKKSDNNWQIDFSFDSGSV